MRLHDAASTRVEGESIRLVRERAEAVATAVDSPQAPLPPGALSVRRGGPGPGLEFALSFAPGDGRDRYAVGALLDADSMRLLARLGSLPVVSSRATLGGKAGQPLVKVVVVASDWAPTA